MLILFKNIHSFHLKTCMRKTKSHMFFFFVNFKLKNFNHHKGTLDMSNDSNLPITQLYSVFTFLRDNSEKSKNNKHLEFLKNGVEKMAKKLEEYWKLIELDSIIPMILDTSIKLELITNLSEKK